LFTVLTRRFSTVSVYLTKINMQTFAVLLAVIAVANANAVVYSVPTASSSATVVRNDRLGGNFAYSTQTVQGVPAAYSYGNLGYNAYNAYAYPVYSYASHPQVVAKSVPVVAKTVEVTAPVTKTVSPVYTVPATYAYNAAYTTPVVGSNYVYSPYTSAVVGHNAYSTVAGVSPINYGYGYNTAAYGYPYNTYGNYYGNYILAKK